MLPRRKACGGSLQGEHNGVTTERDGHRGAGIRSAGGSEDDRRPPRPHPRRTALEPPQVAAQ